MTHLYLVPDIKSQADEDLAAIPVASNVLPLHARFDAEAIAAKLVAMAQTAEQLGKDFSHAVAKQAKHQHLLRAHALKVCVLEQLMSGARYQAFGFKTAHEMLDFVTEVYVSALV